MKTPNSSSETIQFECRKQDHIRLALDHENEAFGRSGLDHIHLPHDALPDINFADITIQSQRFGQSTATPFFISSMTGGHHDAININQRLAIAAQETGWAMGVGSQRKQLFDSTAAKEWQLIRAQAPKATLFGNLGLAQLIETSTAQIEDLVGSLNASAMIIHLNPLQEVLQPEGTPQYRGGIAALERVGEALSVPIIVKETGCGFSAATLKKLNALPIKAVDVSGLGGTHWGRIEGKRSQKGSLLANAAEAYKHWGISTTQSLLNAKLISPHYALWGSGGVRSGLDAAKLLALGAEQIGFAKPMLEAALDSEASIIERMHQLEYELKIALFCTACTSIQDLQEKYPWQ